MHEKVPLEDPDPGCARDVVLDLAGGGENHGEDPPGDTEPPDETSTGVFKLQGGGDPHEDVPLGDTGGDTGFHDDVRNGDQEQFEDDDGQGGPRPSQ